MQTFLAYDNFYDSAWCLDNLRLNKQIIEARDIWRRCLGYKKDRYTNHPAVKMWKGYENSLLEYGVTCYNEWIDRFHKKLRGGRACHEVGEELLALLSQEIEDEIINGRERIYPYWLGDLRFHSSHRAALLAKKPDWYKEFNWEEEPIINYWWPGGVFK